MRVVHVTPTMFGGEGIFGGGERYPLELARAVSRQVPCRLVTYGSRARRRRDPDGLEVVVLRARQRARSHPAHPMGAGLVRALSDADIVHAHQLHSRVTKLALHAATLRRQRRAVTDHGLAGATTTRQRRRVERFLTVSRYSAELLGAAPEHTRVIMGGADPGRFRPDGGDRRSGVLFVGRLTPHKGVDRLIRAVPAGAELTIVGSGGHDPALPESGYVDDLTALAATADGRVTFAGRASEADLPLLMRRCSVLALPSVDITCYGRRVEISELLGLVLIEAMASGTPVVASRIGGVAEVVADGETGLLVPPGDVAALGDRLATVLADHRMRAAMGRRARELACDRFTWEACARRCIASYEELLA
jgi:glycosyltransferase involved in cell wall biosynthesis